MNDRSDVEIAAEFNRIFGEPVEGRDFDLMPEDRADDQLQPEAALFLDLLSQARPGMSLVEALANGAYYKAALIRRVGMTAEDVAAWCDRNRGYSLVVHLTQSGRPYAVHKLLRHHDAEQYVAQNPNAVVVASWGLT